MSSIELQTEELTPPPRGQEPLPEHVRRIIDKDGEIEFTPPSFERWLGRLYMVRTMTAMVLFGFTWLVNWVFGQGWDVATVRGIIAAVAGYFFAWAVALFVFGEMYDVEVRDARSDREHKERERTRRIEEYYRARLRAQDPTAPDPFPHSEHAQPQQPHAAGGTLHQMPTPLAAHDSATMQHAA